MNREAVTLEPDETHEVRTDTKIVEIEQGSKDQRFWKRRPTNPADLSRRYHDEGQTQAEIAADLRVTAGQSVGGCSGLASSRRDGQFISGRISILTVIHR